MKKQFTETHNSRNKAPRQGATYIYRGTQLYVSERGKAPFEVDLPENLLVTDIVKTETSDVYYFRLMGDERLFVSHQGWAFVLNTPENRAILGDYNDSMRMRDAAQARLDLATHLLITLR